MTHPLKKESPKFVLILIGIQKIKYGVTYTFYLKNLYWSFILFYYFENFDTID